MELKVYLQMVRMNGHRFFILQNRHFSKSFVSCFVLISPEKPLEAHAEMGRKEGDYDWKKSTDNIQDVFEFMEVLGS